MPTGLAGSQQTEELELPPVAVAEEEAASVLNLKSDVQLWALHGRSHRMRAGQDLADLALQVGWLDRRHLPAPFRLRHPADSRGGCQPGNRGCQARKRVQLVLRDILRQLASRAALALSKLPMVPMYATHAQRARRKGSQDRRHAPCVPRVWSLQAQVGVNVRHAHWVTMR